MKFRRLTDEELEGLSDEFIKFLIVNGVDANRWQQIKGDEPMKAISIIETFSDFIFEQSLSRIQFLEYSDFQSISVFKCDEDKIHLIRLEAENSFDDSEALLHALNPDYALEK
ncbi:MAG: hypothetical protein J5I52_01545 [Saprospiraceae bacterium]|nr:MAG: hypothetical protein UZ09_BCD002001365 [Bacteroidetes bacterium OLB9]MCO6462810.1 hypothetical protein [Saprospiraceae bacterium]MCZ2336731.1 DUF6495 family protein [Chitinophagales bacterium]